VADENHDEDPEIKVLLPEENAPSQQLKAEILAKGKEVSTSIWLAAAAAAKNMTVLLPKDITVLLFEEDATAQQLKICSCAAGQVVRSAAASKYLQQQQQQHCQEGQRHAVGR
jgi:hypothetical protein